MWFTTKACAVLFLASMLGLTGGPWNSYAFAQDLTVAQLLDKAQACLHHGDWAAAIPPLEQALILDPKHKSARSALISTLMRVNRIADAERHAQPFSKDRWRAFRN
jgi:hypothetical protein